MKALIKVFLALFLFVSLVACEKDDPQTEASESPQPAKVESRTGQDEEVFFDGSGVFAPATGNVDSIQEVVNLRQYDSIHYTTNWLSPSISPQGTECWKYNIVFFRDGQVVKVKYTFAKFRGLQYTQYPTSSEGWNEDVLFFHATKTLDFQLYWDDECMKFKFAYRYMKRIFRTESPPEIRNEYIKSNSCIRNPIQYPRKFKP